MALHLGSSGATVQRLQRRLRELGQYKGPADGAFGGGTEAAVKNYQRQEQLTVTGRVDAETWERLFDGEPLPHSELASASVAERCLALTGSFETGGQPPDCFCGLSGDFDNQGLSFGVLQWNVGQNTLQPLLRDAATQYPDVCQSIFHENLDTLRSLGTASLDHQLAFVRSIQNRGRVDEPWRGMLTTLGRTPEFRGVQSAHAAKVLNQAMALCGEFDLTSQRALALMFDIVTQNGSIGPIVKSQIMADYAALPALSPDELEVARMRSIGNRRAAACRPAFVDDVRTRKLTIVEGKGTVHGIAYDLEEVFCLTLEAFSPPANGSGGALH